MKVKNILYSALTLLLVSGLVTPSLAKSNEMPTEPIGGQPQADAKVSVKDWEYQLAYQRAFEVVLWSMPAMTNYGFHRAAKLLGAGPNEILAWSAPAKPNFEALTPNNAAPYIISQSDLRKGPVVIEIPAATDKASLFGQVVDHWFFTIADVGPIGVDKGTGAKLLFTPPGYTGKVPSGFTEIKSPSYRIDFVLRSVPSSKGTQKDAYALGKKLKMYFLSELPNPKPTRFIDPLDLRFSSLPYYDERWFDELYEIINVENVSPRDKIMMGMLKHLGMEKGKPFNPDAKTKKAMRQAVIDANHYMSMKFLELLPDEPWWKDRYWRNIFLHDADMGFQWETKDVFDYEKRGIRPWFTATYFPSKVAKRPATMYIATTNDKDGNLLEAGKNYALTVPKDVPVKQFWSLTVYDQATWAFIYSKEQRPGLSTYDVEKMKQNKDGSVTLYVGPKAPKGYENNWIPTVGKAPYLMFRFYGPKDAFYDKSFKLNDVELVK